jgi:pimeloyl-ACP methyl ester carboxylesterase
MGVAVVGCSGQGAEVDLSRGAEAPAAAGSPAVGARAEAPTAASARAPTQHQVKADDGHALAIWEKPPTTLETRGVIVLLHGRTWSSLPDFDLQVPGESLSLMDALGREGYRSYALDLRGYGASERDASGWLDPDRAARDLDAGLRWVAEREQVQPILLGWSQGAIVSHLAVQRDPSLVQAMVLYGYPSGVRNKSEPREAPEQPERAPTTAEAAASDFITPGSISSEAVQAFVDACLRADPIRADWRDRHRFNELDPRAIRVPTLVIHGVGDPIASVEGQSWLFSGLGHADRQWIVLPDSDHAAHLEVPDKFVAAVLGFLHRPR